MTQELPILPSDIETIAELRDLYRAAEARAARLRLLSTSAQDIAEAGTDEIGDVLNQCARRLAFFTGARGARILAADGAHGIPIRAPGEAGRIVARIEIDGLETAENIEDAEDRDAFRMHLGLMGAAIDRAQRESERVDLLEALRERERSLEQMVEKLFSAQEEERRRVSRELHDGVAQTATALARMIEGTGPGNANDRLAQIARGLVTELRGVIAGLRPTLLDDLGLVAALHSLADSLEDDGYRVTRAIDGEGASLSAAVETALFRLAQEAVSNIRKHAGGPCAVDFTADLRADAAPRFLRIGDKGGGCRIAAGGDGAGDRGDRGQRSGHHIGIDVMRERMAMIGGRLQWEAQEGEGVTVEAILPAEVRA